MIVVSADLFSAVSSERDENLCRVEIANDGTGTMSRGNYDVRLFARGGGRLVRVGRVEDWPRNARPAWRLIQAAFESLSLDGPRFG